MTDAQILATSKATESEGIAFTSTCPTEADFEAKCKHVALHATENVHVAFDGVAHAGNFLVKKDLMIDLRFTEFTRVSAIGNSTSGNLYILARR